MKDQNKFIQGIDTGDDGNIFEDLNKSNQSFDKTYQQYNKYKIYQRNKLKHEIDVQFDYGKDSILKNIKKTCNLQGFEFHFQNAKQFIAINTNPKKITGYFFSCLSLGQFRPGILIIEINLKKNQIKCCYTISFILIKGHQQSLDSFVNIFKQMDDQKSDTQNNLDNAEQSYLNQGAFQEEKFDSPALPSNLESNAYCHFSKILSCDQYSLGKRVNDYIQHFNQDLDYKNSPNISLQNVLLVVNNTVEVFFNDYNYAKKETKNLMSFCRLSVERYLFSKIKIEKLYETKFQNQNIQFNEKTNKIQQQLSYQQQLKFLDVDEKFMIINEDLRPYNNAIKELGFVKLLLESLNDYISPSEKLRCILLTHALMRSQIIDFHKGRIDIQSMDEELPLIIYIITNTKCQNLVSTLNLISDYVNYFVQFEIEAKIITSFLVSIDYITLEWKID